MLLEKNYGHIMFVKNFALEDSFSWTFKLAKNANFDKRKYPGYGTQFDVRQSFFRYLKVVGLNKKI